jgi:hypothetical protein
LCIDAIRKLKRFKFAFVIVKAAVEVIIRSAYAVHVERASTYVAEIVYSRRNGSHGSIYAVSGEIEVSAHLR